MPESSKWSDGESNPDLLNAIQHTTGDTSQNAQPTHSHFGELTLGEALELRDLQNRHRQIALAIPTAGNRVTAPRGELLKRVLERELGRVAARIEELQAKRLAQAVSHG